MVDISHTTWHLLFSKIIPYGPCIAPTQLFLCTEIFQGAAIRGHRICLPLLVGVYLVFCLFDFVFLLIFFGAIRRTDRGFGVSAYLYRRLGCLVKELEWHSCSLQVTSDVSRQTVKKRVNATGSSSCMSKWGAIVSRNGVASSSSSTVPSFKVMRLV